MSSSRWPEVERLCQAALERPPESRAAFLAGACGDDDALRSEVESLLAQLSRADSFIETPALEMDAQREPDPGLMIGQRVGIYQVVSWLGAGGMGEVYRARDQKLGREVAIKILPPAFTSDPERLARFAREARVLAALNHPHIGAIYGVEDAGPVRALVLELVDGPTLADRIERGRIPVVESLTIARQIANALEAAHEKGIVHRDLKPANIKITAAGVVKVLDFGLAKAASSDGIHDLSQSPKITVGGTHEGVLRGTAAYMSPEQARGQAVDKRTDIWAFGCVLYEMLTGRPVFSGSTVSDTLAAVLEREPDWTPLSNAMPAAIHRLLRRCLEKNSKLRLHDIADARIEIDEALVPSPTGQPTSYGWPKQWAAAAVMLVVGLGLGAWAVSRFRQPDTGGPVLRLQITPPDGGQFGVIGDAMLRRGPGLALSPDGKTAVYGATVNGQYALWLRSLDGTLARALRGTEDARLPVWSPDGQSIAFFAKGKLQKIDVAGGPAVVICCDAPALYFGAVWAPDDRILVGILAGTLASVPASGGTLSALTTLNKSMGDVVHAWPQVLPGNHFLYFNGSNRPENNGVIYAASFEKPNERVRLIASETSAVYTTGPDGRGYLLWQRGGTLVAQEFDGTKLKLSGEPRPIAEAIGMVGSTAFIAVAASSSGTLLYANASLQPLTWFDRAGKRLGTLGEPGQYDMTSFSLDGKQIATTRMEAGRELVLIDVDRAASSRATFDSLGGFMPVWSPDGHTILFVGDNVTALYRKDATGAAPDQRLATWPTHYDVHDWSRDGHSLLTSRCSVETRCDLWVFPVTPDGHLADTQAKRYLGTPANEWGGRFSPEPNPRWVAYQSDESGHDEVYVQSFPEPRGPHRISTNGGTAPQWGPSGRELFYLAPDGKVMAVSVKLGSDTIEAFEPRALFTIPRDSFFEVAPDGQRFLVNMPDPTPHPLNVIVNWPALLKSKATGP